MAMGLGKKLRFRFEWLAMMAVQGLGSLLPVAFASAVGGTLAGLIGPKTGRQRVALRNLQRCFPEKEAAWHDATAKAMWQNQGRTIFEYACLEPFLEPKAGKAPRCEIYGLAHLQALAADGIAGLIFSAHYGNWELVTRSLKVAGVQPVHLVYRPANNPYLNNHIRHLQAQGGAQLIAKGAAGARELIKAMKQNSHVVMLVDQKMNDGLPVPFFGRDAMTAPALAQIAQRFDAPIVPVKVTRLRNEKGQFCAQLRVDVSPPFWVEKDGDKHTEIAKTMVKVNGIIEDWVKEDPAQWLWLHKRWPD